MRVTADRLSGRLGRGLAPVYLITGDEPLLVEECVDAVRVAADAAGFKERQILTVEPGFDWDSFYASTQSLSLFCERRLIELRIPSGNPGEIGAGVLVQIAGEKPADIVLVVTAGKLGKQARAAKWSKALEATGVAVTVYPVEPAQLPAWVGRRMRARGLKPGPGVIELLAHYMEGNLLACAQEIDKLAMLAGDGEITLDDIEGNLSDNARFNVFALADACLEGNTAASLRILNGLRAEGVQPVLILWALAREIRELGRMSAAVAAGSTVAQVLDAHKVWARRRPLVRQALGRARPSDWMDLLTDAAQLDRVVKGRASGDAWQRLERLALATSGFRKLPAQIV